LQFTGILASEQLHIVSFNVPYPPDYGGIIDVFYKIKALHALGVRVHLHCYQYGRPEEEELTKYCASVQYYRRRPMWQSAISSMPFIVHSRRDPALLRNLLEIDAPILFEGVHTCFLLKDPALKGRFRMVRMHNNEPHYYQTLAKREHRIFQKTYFSTEARRLQRFENTLKYADKILCISRSESEYYAKKFEHVSYLSAFHGHTDITGRSGIGDFVLYHGNLSVNENIEAVLYIISEVFSRIEVPLVIAGAAPDEKIYRAAAPYSHISIVADPSHAQLTKLIADAHIHFLMTFQETGIKLKLLHALFGGRFCVVNRQMVEGTGLEPFCICIHQPGDAIKAIETYMRVPFTEEDKKFREPVKTLFSDTTSARELLTWLQEHRH